MSRPIGESTIEEQIARLYRQYEEAIRGGEEFHVLKQIREQVKSLKQLGDNVKSETGTFSDES